MDTIDQIVERVERLLLRHEELQRTNVLLQQQVKQLLSERDALKSRLGAAGARMDVLLTQINNSQQTAQEAKADALESQEIPTP